MKTFTLKVNENELKALINHHAHAMLQYDASNTANQHTVERSSRIHDLTKRLNRETPEIETDPRPGVGTVEKANTENAGWPE